MTRRYISKKNNKMATPPASPLKRHMSGGTEGMFLDHTYTVETSRIKKFDPYRLVTEEGKLPSVWSQTGIQKLTESIQRIGLVPIQFTIWVIPAPWLLSLVPPPHDTDSQQVGCHNPL
jgi:hypothetical protein